MGRVRNGVITDDIYVFETDWLDEKIPAGAKVWEIEPQFSSDIDRNKFTFVSFVEPTGQWWVPYWPILSWKIRWDEETDEDYERRKRIQISYIAKCYRERKNKK